MSRFVRGLLVLLPITALVAVVLSTLFGAIGFVIAWLCAAQWGVDVGRWAARGE